MNKPNQATVRGVGTGWVCFVEQREFSYFYYLQEFVPPIPLTADITFTKRELLSIPPSVVADMTAQYQGNLIWVGMKIISQHLKELGASVQVVVKNPDNKVARIMKLPKNSEHPHYKGLHLENDWCEKAGCVPVMDHPGDIGGIDG